MHSLLSDLRVVEASSFVAAPSCGLHLAQLGATVIRLDMIGGGPVITQIFGILMVMGLFLAVMTAGAGSSRPLSQGPGDGWLARFLGDVNSHGSPHKAMWTDVFFNIFLVALASDAGGYFYVLAISNVGYILFNFLNLNAGWIHRIDSAHMQRPWNCLLYTSDAADERSSVDLGGRRIIKKKKKERSQ